MSQFMEYWFPAIRDTLWLGFIVYLFTILQKTYRQARERKRLSRLEERFYKSSQTM